MKLKVTGLTELEQLPDDILKATKKASKIALKKLAEQQEQFILNGTKPNGGNQEQNGAATERAKERMLKNGKIKYNKPLYRSGLLADAKQWKVMAGKQKATLKPPKERQSIVYILKSKGYITVLHELPSGFPDILQKEIDAQIEKAMKKRKV